MVVGQPVVRLRLSASAPAASLSVKLCDVFPDGTSALITRGTLDLRSATVLAAPLVPGEQYDVELLLDACAYRPDPGHRLRLSVAGADWPNTIAPPAPVTLTVHGGSVDAAAVARLGSRAAGSSSPGAESSSEDADRRDLVGHPRRAAPHHDLRGPQRRVLRRAARGHRAGGLPGRGRRRPPHASPSGRRPRRRTASPGPTSTIRVVSTLRVDIGPDGYDVVIEADAFDDEEQVGHREWREHLPR